MPTIPHPRDDNTVKPGQINAVGGFSQRINTRVITIKIRQFCREIEFVLREMQRLQNPRHCHVHWVLPMARIFCQIIEICPRNLTCTTNERDAPWIRPLYNFHTSSTVGCLSNAKYGTSSSAITDWELGRSPQILRYYQFFLVRDRLC